MTEYKLVPMEPTSGVVPSRDDLIQCLLATRGQSEGAAADAILSMLTADPHPEEQQSAPDIAGLVEALEALETVKAVLESNDPAIADTVRVPGAPETLLDHVCAALAAYRKGGEE